MPAVVAGAAASALLAGSTLSGIGFSLSAFAGSLVLGGLSYALTPKPKNPSIRPGLGGSTVAVRQSDLTRQIAYGHTRITRGYAHMWSTGANGYLHCILMLGEGPMRAINEVWVNDYCIPPDWIDADGNVTQGRYAGYLTIRKHLGTETQSADSLAVANLPEWTEDHRLAGIAYLYIIMKKNQDVYPTGLPNFSAIVEGPSLYDPRAGTENWSTNIALFCRDFLRNETYGYGALSDDMDDENMAAQMNICDEIVDTAQVDIAVTAVDTATNIMTLDGDILKLCFGDRVRVSSDGSVPDGLSSGTDYYVIPYQVKDTPRILLAASLDDAMAKNAINITSAGSGAITVSKTGEPRYHGGGLIDVADPLSQTMNNLVTCMAGRAVNVGGFWTLLAGAWRTPEMSLGIDDLRGAMAVQRGIPMAEAFNSTKGLFVSPLNFYQQSDYPAARYQEFIDEDGGIESPKDLNLAFIQRATTAQRIAKIELLRSRQDIAFKSDFSARLLQVKPGDNVDMTIDSLGWDEKVFEVTQFAFSLRDGAIVPPLALRETTQDIFDWDSDEEIGLDPAPNTDLPNPFQVDVPSDVAYSSRKIDTQDGDSIYTLVLSWAAHDDQLVQQYGDFEVQFRPSGVTDWLPSFFVDGGMTTTDVISLSVNTQYDLRIRARNSLGKRSNWVTLLNAAAGSSGGIGATNDWGSVADSVGTTDDWGSVASAPTTTNDWGYVA